MNHLPPPQRLGATQGEGAAEAAFAQGAAGGVLWGSCPSARVSERVGIPAQPLAEDLPVHPAGAGFRFPQRKLFPAFGLSEYGERGGTPCGVRSFFILLAFHVGRVKGQTGTLGGWRVRV